MSIMDKIDKYIGEAVNKIDKCFNESVFDAEAIVGNKKITKPMSAKNEKDAEDQFKKFLEMQMKRGHIDKGEIKNIKIKKA